MHLDRGRVERERLDLDPHDLLRMQLLEYPIENAVLGLAIHPRVDRVPTAETLRQPSYTGSERAYHSLLADSG